MNFESYFCLFDVFLTHLVRFVEDVIRCALSESTGLIAWGNRGGDLFLSDVNA